MVNRAFLIFYLSCISNSIFARSLVASADKLGQDTSRIALGLGLFGLVVAGIYFMLGKQDANTKVTNALLGLTIIVLAPSIITFVRGIA